MDLYNSHQLCMLGDHATPFEAVHSANRCLESNIGRMYPTWSEGIPFNRYRFDFGIQISDCLPSQDSSNILGCFKESTALCLLVFCGWAWPEPFSCEIGC